MVTSLFFLLFLCVLVGLGQLYLLVRTRASSAQPAPRPSSGLPCSDLWRWDGTVGRGRYALIGVLGFTLKHNLDRIVASAVFHRRWSVFNYVIPPDKLLRIGALSREDAIFLTTLVALALPFIWVGVALTLRRLRAVGFPSWLVVVFFLVLAVLPSAAAPSEPARPSSRMLGRVIPDHPIGSAAMALLIAVLAGLAATGLGVSVLRRYGWGLFVGLPFCIGLLSVLLYSYHRPRSCASCLMVTTLSVLLLGAVLLAVAIEGVICLIMAAPIGLPLAAIGGLVGYAIQRRPVDQAPAPTTLLVLLLAVPSLMGAEALARPAAPLFAVRTAMEVPASPEQVWRHVVSFAEIPQPQEWWFRLGIAYPVRAVIHGRGAGAVRYCMFSTGAFVEPIEVWEPPRRLKFSVTQNPPPMQEWTPYAAIHPPHLAGFLVSEGGQFLLTPLPGGGTRLEGTTWYRHHMWPAGYWRLWADAIIHRIHLRVLRHIARLARASDVDSSASPAASRGDERARLTP